MNDYKAVQDALAKGADPAMMCATCPWDRNCITPPSMTKADIDAEIKKSTDQETALADAAKARGEQPSVPIGSLMTAIVFGGKDTSAQVCPVFALRLKSAGGRAIADKVRGWMTEWDDES